MFHSAPGIAARTSFRSPTASLAGRYNRLEATKQVFLLHPNHHKSTEPVSAHNRPSSTKLKVNTSSKPTSPSNQSTIPQSFSHEHSHQTKPNQTQIKEPNKQSHHTSSTTHHVHHHARRLRPNPLPQPHALQEPPAGDRNSTSSSQQRHPAPPTRTPPWVWRRMASVSSVLVHQTVRGPWAVRDLWEEGEGGVSTAVICGCCG